MSEGNLNERRSAIDELLIGNGGSAACSCSSYGLNTVSFAERDLLKLCLRGTQYKRETFVVSHVEMKIMIRINYLPIRYARRQYKSHSWKF